MLRRGSLLLLGFAVAPYALIAAVGGQKKPSYYEDVYPELKGHCYSCHSGSDPSAGLDLSTPEGIASVVKPGDSKNSELIRRLRGIGGTQMPMGFAPLTDPTISKIASWIDSGAKIDKTPPKHWAYVPPKMPTVPQIGTKWVRNPIDAFVLQRLQKEGLKPSPEASKETLLRRVYLDLIGLPPTPEQTDAFLADKRPDAYERVVDSLMKNPHYGERQAEPWLDLSRYADSDGYEKDLNRTAWEYRDWLIRAFNKNVHYNQFTIDQLAGDLLPNPTIDDLVATGFNRNSMFNREGGVDQEQAHFEVIVDRLDTTADVWLGSTLQCARCHDHKYDPFTQRDFYRFSAFFSDSQIYPVGPKSIGEEKWEEATIRVPSAAQETRERKLKTEVAEMKRRLSTWSPDLQSAYDRWIEAVKQGASWLVFRPDKLESQNGASLKSDGFGVITSTGKRPDQDDYVLTGKAGLRRITGLSLEAIADKSLPQGGPGRSDNGNFVVSYVRLQAGGAKPVFAKAVSDFKQPDYEADKALGKVPGRGWAVNFGQGKSHELVLELDKPIDVPPDTPVTITIGQHWPGGQHLLGKFQISLTGSDHPVELFLTPDVRKMLAVRTPGDAADRAVQGYFRTITPLLDADRSRLTSLESELNSVEAAVPTALVMRDKPHDGPLTAFIHNRGEFLSPTKLVTAGFPACLTQANPSTSATIHSTGQLRATEDKDSGIAPAPVPHINDNGSPLATGPVLTRLDLAKWLVSRDNPLTARVEVNRLWEQFFGAGIVETSEDFGTQGSGPSHPELLDWLACTFMDKGWDMKAMVRLIVTSSTYRQSSNATRALMEKDPKNRLLARGPRFRLDAETIRDNALCASGLLDAKIGGPSVFPYQPDGVWDDPYSGEEWTLSTGGDQYRRGLYTFIKRSSPYPSMLNFDGTSREECTIRRIRTNTPLQALSLLNDKAVFDCAVALAKRMAAEGGKTVASRLTYGFRLCTGRHPEAVELNRLEQLLSKLDKRYSAVPADAKKIAGTPDQAAWAMVGNVLLNLDETVTKG